MASSKQIKLWINAKKKTILKLDKEIKTAKSRIAKLEGDLKKAVAIEKSAPKKSKSKKKVAKRKSSAKKK